MLGGRGWRRKSRGGRENTNVSATAIQRKIALQICLTSLPPTLYNIKFLNLVYDINLLQFLIQLVKTGFYGFHNTWNFIQEDCCLKSSKGGVLASTQVGSLDSKGFKKHQFLQENALATIV